MSRAATAILIALALPSAASAAGRTPVVLFPGYGATKLQVTVKNQAAVAGCPRSGSFQDWFGDDHPSTTFSQPCRDRLLTLRYRADRRVPMAMRFSLPPGVKVTLAQFGRTSSAPLYESFFKALVAAGYVRDRDLRVAGYNFRLTPDMDGFLPRTRMLIEATARANGGRPVRLVGHSNGPPYVQYLLTHMTAAWKAKYIQGFTTLAGNFPGQGALWTYVFSGLNVETFTLPTTVENARTSARLVLTSPATYMSAPDPAVFGRREVVIRNAATGRSYTPRDYRALLRDAHLSGAQPIADYYLGFVRFRGRADFPNVDVAAEKGSGIPTQVGTVLPSLRAGQVVPPTATLITRDGDINQEDITNDAVGVWRGMRCFRFRLTDNPGVNHIALPGDAGVIRRLLADLARKPTARCSHTGT